MAKLQLQIEKLELASSKLRAMAHPMRIAILELLQYDNKMSVTEIYRKLKIEQAAASHHLNILKNKGILQSQRDGKKIYYTLRSSVLSEILDCLNRCTDE